jgi:hypothetical protein
MEYYGYAERNAESQVDWATIGKGMSDMLAETNRIREEKKQAIDNATRQYSKTLTEVPLGEHVGAREAALRFADNAAQYQLMQDRLLRSGALKLKDYTVARQNLIDGTEQTFKMYNDFQTQAAEKMERARAGESQALELETMQQLQSWGNFNESDIYINPTNGALTIGKVTQQEIDGKTVRTMSTNPADFTTIGNAQANLYAKYDKFKYEDKLTALASSLGKEINAVRELGSESKAGSIKTYLDVMQKTSKGKNGAVIKFIDAETKAIESMLTNDFDRLSVLTEDIKEIDGKPFKFVYSEAETKGHPENIYLEKKAGSGFTSPKLTAEQNAAVVERLREQIRLKYDRVETISPYSEPTRPRPSEAEIAAGEGRKSKIATASLWNNYYLEKDPSKKNNVLQAIIGSPEAKAQGIIGIDADSEPGILIIENETPSQNRRIKLSDIKNLNDWSQIGTGVHGISDKNILNKATGGGNPSYVSSSPFTGRAAKGETLGYNEVIKEITPDLFQSKDAESLISMLEGLGVEVETATVGNDVTITSGENEIKVNLNEDDEDAASAAINLKSWLDRNVTAKNKAGKKVPKKVIPQPSNQTAIPPPLPTGGTRSLVADTYGQ